jgi:hypothetical protein
LQGGRYRESVAAAGNQGTLGSTAITRHLWVIPVVAYDLQGRPMDQSNLGSSIGRRGLGAPGDRITSLGAEDGLFIVNAKFWSLRDCQWSTSVRKNDPFVEPTLIFPIFCQQSGLSGSKKWFPQPKFSFTSFQ